MATNEFRISLEQLLKLASTKRTAIMCAEALPWRCHRSLIGDALLARGVNVEDIMSATSRRPHELTPFAKVEGINIVYPAEFRARETSAALREFFVKPKTPFFVMRKHSFSIFRWALAGLKSGFDSL